MMSATPYFRLSGTSSPRCSSVVACSEIARFGISGSRGEPLERRQQPDGRQRDAPRRHAQAVLVGQDPQRLHRLVVVVQRLAHAHQHDVEGRVAQARARRRARGPGRRSRRRSGSGRAPSCRSGRSAHAIAQPTCVEMQKVIAGVSGMNTDSIWRAVGEARAGTSRCRRRSARARRRAASSSVKLVGERVRGASATGRSSPRSR